MRQGDDAARADIRPVKQGLERLECGGVGRLREQAEWLVVALEQAAQDVGDGKGPVAVGHKSENLGGQSLSKEDRALCMATGTKVPGATGKGQKVLRVALGTTNPGEASLKPATGQELLHGTNATQIRAATAKPRGCGLRGAIVSGHE